MTTLNNYIKKQKVSIKYYGIHLGTIACLLLMVFSCEEFVEIKPPITEVVSKTVYTDDETAIAAIRGIYIEMMTGGFASGSQSSVTNLTGLSSDEFLDFQGDNDRGEINRNALSTTNGAIARLWNEAYTIIYYVNSVLEGLEQSDGLTTTTKLQLEGEAKFIRAFFHFYLVNLFGDVPIITSTNFRVNNEILRSLESDVFQQIITDLIQAQNLLAEDYAFSLEERVQVNKFAATALLARAYLYIRDWEKAEIEATKVIDNTTLYSLEVDLDEVFLANSMEAIWQLKPIFPGQNTREARIFINEVSPRFQVLTSELSGSFEGGDKRRTSWVDSIIFEGTTYYHPAKYKINENNEPLTEYSMVLRLAEQYLIRAEARAQLNNTSEALADLNILRNRAGLGNISITDQNSLLQAVAQERRIELFSEWGHRWFDLKRSGTAESVLSSIFIKDWQSTDVLYPIPQTDRDVNGNLTQNDGY